MDFVEIISKEEFYNGRFLDITFLQIFIFLAVPYMILYFYKEFTEFDNFTEKWEGAIFIFFFGFLSYILTNIINFFLSSFKILFFVSYFLSLVLISLILFFLWKCYYSKKNRKKLMGKVLLMTGDTYWGEITSEDNFVFVTDEKKILKYDSKENKNKKVSCKCLGFKREEVDKILIR